MLDSRYSAITFCQRDQHLLYKSQYPKWNSLLTGISLNPFKSPYSETSIFQVQLEILSKNGSAPSNCLSICIPEVCTGLSLVSNNFLWYLFLTLHSLKSELFILYYIRVNMCTGFTKLDDPWTSTYIYVFLLDCIKTFVKLLSVSWWESLSMYSLSV